ncbi:unnamed protein product [Prunus brigantina]
MLQIHLLVFSPLLALLVKAYCRLPLNLCLLCILLVAFLLVVESLMAVRISNLSFDSLVFVVLPLPIMVVLVHTRLCQNVKSTVQQRIVIIAMVPLRMLLRLLLSAKSVANEGMLLWIVITTLTIHFKGKHRYLL